MHQAIIKISRFVLTKPYGIAGLLCLACVSLQAPCAFAQDLEVTLPSGVKALAEFHAGRTSQPAILILHGFLQTHHSPPMSSLASNLTSKEFTVLNPTISLGFSKRSQSSACEAVHTYTMEEEVAEIGYWVNWLAQKGYKDIVLIGFSSTGNLGVLLYNAQSNHFPIRKSILVSLNPLNMNTAEHLKIQRKAGAQRNNISRFNLGYCKNNFAGTDKSYLSYARHDENNMLELLQHTTVPSELIFGTDDHILPADWLSRIESHHAQSPFTVSQISGANHFFGHFRIRPVRSR